MRLPLIKTLTVLFALLFLTVQTASAVHVTANGTDHSHDGVACEVALVAAEQAIVSPPADITAPTPRLRMATIPTAVVDVPAFGFTARAPPPRGPPALFET